MKKSQLKFLIKEEIRKILKENNTYSQLEFTAKGQLLSDFLNDDSGKNEDYHLNTRDENIIQDMGMYIEEMYGDNKFTSLDVFALDIASQEYQDPQKGAINVLRKIKTAINKGWVSVVSYKGDLSKDKVDPDKPWLDPESEDELVENLNNNINQHYNKIVTIIKDSISELEDDEAYLLYEKLKSYINQLD